jgi:GNAT superfamily N-acetyltransferase
VSPTVEPLTGAALEAALPDLARLRVAVFRDWPYLYDGDDAYERAYVRRYADSPGAVVVAARDGDRIVGAATAAPMEDHAPEFAAALAAAGFAPSQALYCGESVLLPEMRGRGVGHAFFDAREAHGRALGRAVSCFCAVIRDPDDPRRPPGHAPLDPFWRRRGYAPVSGAVASYRWREVGAAAEIDHPMRLWLRRL